jgi:hypothetical protein
MEDVKVAGEYKDAGECFLPLPPQIAAEIGIGMSLGYFSLLSWRNKWVILHPKSRLVFNSTMSNKTKAELVIYLLHYLVSIDWNEDDVIERLRANQEAHRMFLRLAYCVYHDTVRIDWLFPEKFSGSH